MDRLKFFDSISGIEYPEMIVKFFDQFIALKQLVEDYGTIVVSEKTDQSISFITSFSNAGYKNKALSNIPPSGPIVIYCRPISVEVEDLSDTDIKFTLK